jgi:hypothetical protein
MWTARRPTSRVQRSELTAVLAEELSRLDSRDALLLTLRFEETCPLLASPA